MSRTRVLVVADSPYFGGVASHVLAIHDAFRGHDRFEILLVTFSGRREDHALLQAAREQDVPIHVFPMSSTFDARVLGALRRFLAEARVDLIHTHGYRGTLLCALVARRVPMTSTCHGEAVAAGLRLRAWQWARLRSMRRRPLTIACSGHVRRWLIARGFGASAVRTIHNACALPDDDNDAVTRAALAIPDDAFLPAYLGRLAPGKGLEHLIDSLANASNTVALVVGDGPLRPALEARARARGVDARFVGTTAQPEPYFNLADVVVLPSKMEALPMTLIEAAAYGKAAIATRVGGIPEVVDDAESGILFDYGDEAALRDALAQCRDPATRQRMGERAHRVWLERFSLPRMARDLAQAYDDVLLEK